LQEHCEVNLWVIPWRHQRKNMGTGADQILFDARWIGMHGIGRFAAELAREIPFSLLRGKASPASPLDPVFLSRQLWALRPKLFFSPGYNGPLVSTVPYVLCVHDLNYVDVSENGAAKRLYFNAIVKPIVCRAARVLTDSDFSRNRILEWSGLPADRIVNVGCGVGDMFSPDGRCHTPGYPYLLYVGNRRFHKNVNRLIEAFALARVAREMHLVISGRLDARLARLIARHQLENRVICAVNISEEELPAYYRGAVGFVFPSLYEGFGLPPLEAMACGTPVLTSNATSLPEVVGDAAILVDPYDVQAIANGMEQLVEDRERRKTMIQAGLLQARKFTWKATAGLTCGALADVLDEHS
jgi:glycosyltransferase involved in cell wall biosynthesis